MDWTSIWQKARKKACQIVSKVTRDFVNYLACFLVDILRVANINPTLDRA
jgi:hypothetical protein